MKKLVFVLMLIVTVVLPSIAQDNFEITEIYRFHTVQDLDDYEFPLTVPRNVDGFIQIGSVGEIEYISIIIKKGKDKCEDLYRVNESETEGEIGGDWNICYYSRRVKGNKKGPTLLYRVYNKKYSTVDPQYFMVLDLNPESYKVLGGKRYGNLEYLGNPSRNY